MKLLVALVLIGIPILAVIFGVWSVFNDIYQYITRSVNYQLRVNTPFPVKYRTILEKYCAYYNALSFESRKEFERKLKRFMYSKRFIPRSIPSVTDEMRVLISATVIQLTFGLREIYLSSFDKILIYADQYYSHINQRYHLGEVNPRAGIIVLSWKSFVEGYGDLTDSFNLGIHEMAHAIHFENKIKNEEVDFLDRKALEQLDLITYREMPIIKSGNHFMRKYAATNEYEFFAVALEYFFEQPTMVKQKLPDLYETLKTLLNQDPLNLYNFENSKGY